MNLGRFISPPPHDQERLSKGWGNMCKYFYGEGHCSNSNVDGVLCGGRQVCDFFSKSNDQEEQACDYDAWYGLYCAKYKRFFCPGKDGCGTFEEYARSFENHIRSTA